MILPDHMIKIRDDAALEHSREWQHEHSDYSYQEGFNKCYEVMTDKLIGHTTDECYRPETIQDLIEENEKLHAQNKIYEGALRYVARHNDTPKQMAVNILDECVTVCTQALAKIEGE